MNQPSVNPTRSHLVGLLVAYFLQHLNIYVLQKYFTFKTKHVLSHNDRASRCIRPTDAYSAQFASLIRPRRWFCNIKRMTCDDDAFTNNLNICVSIARITHIPFEIRTCKRKHTLTDIRYGRQKQLWGDDGASRKFTSFSLRIRDCINI